MNILFLTLVNIQSIEDRGIYQDLLRTFRNEGHDVTIVTPVERRAGVATNFQKVEGVSILQVKTLNIQKTNIIEKGIGTLAIEYQYLFAIKKYLNTQRFDLILYSTPPITFVKVIEYIKKRDGAYAYLLLKDIFPQNAVDMKLMKKNSWLHRYFVKKEKALYQVSDTIGCMSEANKTFVLANHSEIDSNKVEVNPNTIEPHFIAYSTQEVNDIRIKYGLPLAKKIFVYGGNLGKPQGLDFLLQTIENCSEENAYFLIVGDGTEYEKIYTWFKKVQPANAKLIKALPKSEYDILLASCSVGLIFLHPDFTIPNFPSRLLSYLEMKKPVLAVVDKNTDVGDVVMKANCGISIISGDVMAMEKAIQQMVHGVDDNHMGEQAWSLLQNEFHVNKSYQLITSKIKV